MNLVIAAGIERKALFGLSKKQVVMLVVLFAGSFIGFLNQTIVAPMLPTLMKEMSVDAATVQWLTTGFTLVNAVMIPVTAFLTDKYSTRGLFLTAMGIFTAGALLCTWGPNFPVLLVGRLIQAAGAGIMMPMIMTVLLLTFPVEQRGRAMGVYGIVNGVAPAVGPVLSGFVVDVISWHWLFVAVTALSVIDIIAACFVLEHGKGALNSKATLDKTSVFLSSLGFGAVLYGCSTIGSTGLSVWPILTMILGAVIVVLFVQRQGELESPMLHVEILKNRKFLISVIITMVVQAAIMAVSILMPIFVQTIAGYSALYSGLVVLPSAILSAILGPFAGRIFDSRGPRAMAITGMILLVVLTVPFCFFTPETSLVWMAFLCTGRGLALTLINMPIGTWGLNALDNKVINHGNAVSNTLRQVAGSFGTALLISVYTAVANNQLANGVVSTDACMFGFDCAFVVQLVLFCVAAVITFKEVKEKPEDVEAIDPQRTRKTLISKIMHRDVYYVKAEWTVAQAAQLFVDKGISGAPIVNVNGRIVGMISDGDLIRAISHRERTYIDPVAMISTVAKGEDDYDKRLAQVMDMPVVQIATARIISVDIHTRFDEVCRVIGENHLKKIPVVEDGKLVGIINRSDITMYALTKYLENHPLA